MIPHRRISLKNRSFRPNLVGVSGEEQSLADYQLHYGKRQTITVRLNDEDVNWQQLGPVKQVHPAEAIQAALLEPIDYPPVDQAIVPGDRVVLVVDPETPQWQLIVAGLRERILSRGIEPESIQVVMNAPCAGTLLETAGAVEVIPHDNVMSGRQVYLASTAEGERIYLPELIGEADYIITVGVLGYDDHFGYRGTNTGIYPAFAGKAERERFSVSASSELAPEDSHGVRQYVDEIGWLLGLQYSIQVVPSAAGEMAHVVSGACDSVLQRGKKLLDESWRSAAGERAETVLISLLSIEGTPDLAGLARGCQVAARLVEADGRVLFLTDLNEIPDEARTILEADSDLDRIARKFTKSTCPEVNALGALIRLTQRAKVYLLSGLDPDLVESLQCIPLSNETELERAIQQGSSYAVLDGGRFAYVDPASD